MLLSCLSLGGHVGSSVTLFLWQFYQRGALCLLGELCWRVKCQHSSVQTSVSILAIIAILESDFLHLFLGAEF